ncbi:hypothetical protein [Aestuariicoccus sp. MJ-SS9]|uniref:hypothetical protein n=1 Tax=Aestuariicoccus sp. MJ-SS9 TaxID=3079855 RepID=UPI00290E6185|nr:hypothetical protein [Aestuariicoccus sp. MJ-SS9]MDU8909789.1 hypothetical protein [Aestuariicoccus sp. MJ-SS9]
MNAIRVPGGPAPDILVRDRRFDEIAVMVAPFEGQLLWRKGAGRLPLNFTAVLAKPLLRADRLHGFARGGHAGTYADGTKMQSEPTDKLAVLHLWFTDEARFMRKAGFIRKVEDTLGRESRAWQWAHWGNLSKRGEDAVTAEFAKQMPSPAEFETLVAQGRIAVGPALWPALRGGRPGSERRDLAELGWHRAAGGDGPA